MGLAARERAGLARFLADAGPDRPTLCDGWTTGDLLVHLLIRERRPDGAAAALVSPLAGYAKRVRETLRRLPWQRQIELFRQGPPLWNPTSWGPLNEAANGGELFIHHEDARRGEAGWQPRPLDADTAQSVAGLLASPLFRWHLRHSPVGIVAMMPDRAPVELHAGTPQAQVHGDPAELLLWVAGRSAVRVTVTGSAEAVDAVTALRRRL